MSSQFFETVSISNAAHAIEHLMYYHVVEQRRPYLDGLKHALKATGLLKFLSARPYLRDCIFPRQTEIKIPASLIVDKIECEDANILQFVKEYIETADGKSNAIYVMNGKYICNFIFAAAKILSLLRAWTGWGTMPANTLRITAEPGGYVRTQACNEELFVPVGLNKEDIFDGLNRLVENCEGFGVI